jgi:hypothetical protein
MEKRGGGKARMTDIQMERERLDLKSRRAPWMPRRRGLVQNKKSPADQGRRTRTQLRLSTPREAGAILALRLMF